VNAGQEQPDLTCIGCEHVGEPLGLCAFGVAETSRPENALVVDALRLLPMHDLHTRNPTPFNSSLHCHVALRCSLWSRDYATMKDLRGSSDGCCGSARPSNKEDCGLSSSEGNGVCTSPRDGQRNRDSNGQNSGRNCVGRCVLNTRGNSTGGSRHCNSGGNSADNFEGDSQDDSGSSPGGEGPSSQPQA